MPLQLTLSLVVRALESIFSVLCSSVWYGMDAHEVLFNELKKKELCNKELLSFQQFTVLVLLGLGSISPFVIMEGLEGRHINYPFWF